MTRPLWMTGGLICLALGWIGIVLPLMPGFVFLLAALFCFTRGNPAWEARLLDHPNWGPPLRDWRDRRAISRRAKKAALLAITLAGLLATAMLGFPAALFSLVPLALVAGWLWTRAE